MIAAGFCLVLVIAVSTGNAEENIVCGEPPEVPKANVDEVNNTYPLGSIVKYNCEFGYVPSGYPRTAKCVFDDDSAIAIWIQPNFNCVPRSCGDPGEVSYARRNGSVFTFSSRVVYTCEQGYILVGSGQRFCETNGKWSGRLPTCRKVQCQPPQHPANGQVVYGSLDYGTVLQYECNKGFVVKEPVERICMTTGQWSGEEPECVETYCKKPEAPLHGTVDLAGGKTTVGSIVIYSCEEGYTLFGSKTSKCFNTGEWTFPTPRCLESCRVPEVDNGRFGVYRGRLRRTFIQLDVDTVLEEGQEVFLRCDGNYDPSGRKGPEIKIFCSKGVWSAEPTCKPATCRMKPPSVPNARLIEHERYHGASLTYLCDPGYVKASYGSTKCQYGSWVGSLPTCKDTHCYRDSAIFSVIRSTVKDKFKSGEIITPECINNHELSKPGNPRLTCNQGEWKGHVPPCVPVKCQLPPPIPKNGQVMSVAGNGHGSIATVSCNRGYKKAPPPHSMKCSFGKWEGHQDICTNTGCNLNELEHMDGVDTSSSEPTSSNTYGKIQCRKGYELRDGNPLCLEGIWQLKNQMSPCQPVPCTVHYVEHGQFENMKSGWEYNWSKIRYDPVTTFHNERQGNRYPHGKELYFRCLDPYVFQGRDMAKRVKVQCERAKWFPQPVCLLSGEPMPVAVRTTTRKPTTLLPRIIQARSSKATVEEIAPTEASFRKEAVTTPESSVLEEHIVTTAPHVNDTTTTEKSEDNCTCIYDYANPDILAFSGTDVVQLRSKVKDGCTVMFVCKLLGYHRLVGSSEIRCENCMWHTTQFPTCAKPKKNDAVITFDSRNNSLLKYLPSGGVVVPYGMNFNISCTLLYSEEWATFSSIPSRIKVDYKELSVDGAYTLFTIVMIKFADSSYDGKYECQSGRGHSNYVIIQVNEPLCPQIESEHLRITYTDGNKVHSRAIFECLDENAVLKGDREAICSSTSTWSKEPPSCEKILCPILEVPKGMTVFYSGNTEVNSQAVFECSKPNAVEGPEVITCLSNGQWSDGVPSCKPVFCTITSLMEVLPDDVAPVEQELTGPEVGYGEVLNLECAHRSLRILGVRNVTCSKSRTWIVDKVSCVKGCGPILKSDESKLVVEPDKDSYRFGEHVTFSCPPGYKLSSDVVKMMCLNNGWSEVYEDIPTCQSI